MLWGLWYVGYTRGEYQTAHARAQDLLAAAHAGEDTGRLLEAHHALWATLSAMGEPAATVPHTQRGIALYDRDRDATQMFVYGGHDSGVCCRHTLGLNRWLLGYPDQALLAMRDASRLSDELQHPMTSVITLWYTAWLHYQRGDWEGAEIAERLARSSMPTTSRALSSRGS